MWGEDGGAVGGEGGNRWSCTVVRARRGQASGHSLFLGKFGWSNSGPATDGKGEIRIWATLGNTATLPGELTPALPGYR